MKRQPEPEQIQRLSVKILDQVRDRLRLKDYTYRTEKSYLYWIKQYILFHISMFYYLRSHNL